MLPLDRRSKTYDRLLAEAHDSGTDFYFKIDSPPLWDLEEQFEPVLIFVCLPLLVHSPNFESRKKLLAELERLLLGPRVSEVSQTWFRSRLRKLFGSSRELLEV